MINVVYLVLVITTGSSGVAVEKIPQANMKQCQINMKAYDDVNHKSFSSGHTTRAHCIVGVK